MISRLLCLISMLTILCQASPAQSNMHFNSAVLTRVFAGNYSVDEFPMQTEYGSPEDLVGEIQASVSADSLKYYLIAMQQFETRNSGSDTLSPTRGIGAARNWMLGQFNRFAEQSEGRLLTGFFEFDFDICGAMHHKNIVAMLPGYEQDAGVIIIEAHLDSRCHDVCDIECLAQGMEDNGSGSALVIELARVLSKYNYKNTIVFVGMIGEEQGLDGSRAMAQYAVDREIKIKLVQNNDIVGGILCGETSSQPSCPGKDHIDSTQVRLFSQGGFNSLHKGVCRFVKLQYAEMLEPLVAVPMRITIMSAEDRTGRGGDHIPFRERGFPAMRFTSANEHGDAFIDPEYHDRQHTSDDILGVDTDSNGELDSFFVDFNYLARNVAINATAATMAAIGPDAPRISDYYFDANTFYVAVESEIDYPEYRIGSRTDVTDYDTIYSIVNDTSGFFNTANPEFFLFLSVMAVDSHGIESIPFEEVRARITGTVDVEAPEQQEIYLFQNRPNPFDESTIISYWVGTQIQYKQAEIALVDMNGKIIERITTSPVQGMNEVLYRHGYGVAGVYAYTLMIDGRAVDEKRMVFAN